jgi:hypothetical protein
MIGRGGRAVGIVQPRPVSCGLTKRQIVFGSKVLTGADLQRAKEVALACGWELEDPVAFAAELREAAGPPAS